MTKDEYLLAVEKCKKGFLNDGIADEVVRRMELVVQVDGGVPGVGMMLCYAKELLGKQHGAEYVKLVAIVPCPEHGDHGLWLEAHLPLECCSLIGVSLKTAEAENDEVTGEKKLAKKYVKEGDNVYKIVSDQSKK